MLQRAKAERKAAKWRAPSAKFVPSVIIRAKTHRKVRLEEYCGELFDLAGPYHVEVSDMVLHKVTNGEWGESPRAGVALDLRPYVSGHSCA